MGTTCTLPEIETRFMVEEVVGATGAFPEIETRFLVGNRVTVNAHCSDNCFSGGEVGTVVGITLSGAPLVRFTNEDNPDSLALLPSGIHEVVMPSKDLGLKVKQSRGKTRAPEGTFSQVPFGFCEP